MKNGFIIGPLALWLCANAVLAQDAAAPKRAKPTGDYATDIATLSDSQQEALDQAKQMLEDAENETTRTALKTAIKDMETASKSLEAAKKNSADLPAAEAAEQAAYQALLKLAPHEYRVTRSRRGSQAGRAGQPGQQQMQQLELTSEENRYETESQAAATPNAEQKQQLEVADRLKELAQRQQDLNDRLRELQTALQQANTEKEKEEIQRELKHLADEERQMLNDVDELRQKADQSPNSSAMTQTSKGLEQTRAETEKAAQQLANQSVSQALASGTRAQQSMQNMRENLRGQNSGQFSQQMRQLQNQARDLAQKEEDIGRQLDSMNDADHKTLDNEAQRQQLAQDIAKQESALTNLLGAMQDVTEQAESAEPLLSEQLYDTLRRSGQMHTDSLLETSGELVDRGFLNKASEMEHAARTNINELRQRVEHAAESVLGSQADALRFAQTELNDLSKQVERSLGGTNANSGPGDLRTNMGGPPTAGTNGMAESGSQTNSAGSVAGARTGNGAGGGTNSSAESQANNSGPGQSMEQRLRARRGREEAGADGQNGGNQRDAQAQQNSGDGAQAGSRDNAQASNGGAGDVSQLRDLVQQIGGVNGGVGAAGPILGSDFANWADRMRDVEQVVDSVALRNQLAAIRERVAAYRAEYRLHGRKPPADAVKIQVLDPMSEVRMQLQEDLARLENARSLVPLDHDPVPDNYSELVRKYYEKLGGGQ